MAKTSWKRRLQAAMFRMPMMITCRQFEDFIVDYLEGDLPGKDRRSFEIHLRFCRECRDYLDAYKASLDAAKQGLADDLAELPHQVPDDLVDAVVATIEESR